MRTQYTHAEIACAYEYLALELRTRPYHPDNDVQAQAVRAVVEALDQLIHTSNLCETSPPFAKLQKDGDPPDGEEPADLEDLI